MDPEIRRVTVTANAAVILMTIIHDADHVRQAINWCYTIPAWLWAVNVLAYTPSGLALLASLRSHKSAPHATIIASTTIAVVFTSTHLWKPFLPIWGIWNQNFFELNVDQLSWTILALTVLVAVGSAIAGGWATGRASTMRAPQPA